MLVSCKIPLLGQALTVHDGISARGIFKIVLNALVIHEAS